MAKLASSVLALMAIVLSGCGGSSETRLEEAELEFKAIEAKLKPIQAEEEPIFNALVRAAGDAAHQRRKELEAVIAGDMGKARELKAAVAAAMAREDRQRRRLGPVHDRLRPLVDRSEALRKEIEELNGCHEDCQAERERSAKLGLKCLDSMIDSGVEFNRADRICRKKHPLPREEILPESGGS